MDQSFGMDEAQPPSFDTSAAQGRTSRNPVNTSYLPQYEPLRKAVHKGDLDATKRFLEGHPEAVSARITTEGETALHIAALFGHLHIIEELVRFLPEDDLELEDKDRITVLHVATYNNNIRIAQCIVEKKKKLLTIPEAGGMIPVTLALDFGHTEMARYLYSVTPFEVLLPDQGNHGAVLLTQCCHSKMLDIALDLIKRCPRLAVTQGRRGFTFFETLATMPSACLSESQLPFWKRWLYKWVHVHQEPAFAINETVISIPESTRRKDDYVRSTNHGVLHQLVRNILHLLGIKNILEAKLTEKQSLELLRVACYVISTLSEEEIRKSRVYSAVLLATERGNPEFIVEAIKAHLPLLWTRTPDRRRIFFFGCSISPSKSFQSYSWVCSEACVCKLKRQRWQLSATYGRIEGPIITA